MDQSDAAILKDGTPVDKGFLAQLLHRLAIAVGKNTNERIGKALEPLLARIKAQEARIERQAQLLSAMSKQIAALERKQQG